MNILKIIQYTLLHFGLCRVDAVQQTMLEGVRTLVTLTNESKAIMSQTMHYNQGELTEINEQFKNISRIKYPVTCNSYYAQMSERSTCPWIFQKNVDNNRIPSEITEAVCRFNTTTACGRATARIQIIRNGCAKHECREVKYYTKVLRRDSNTENHYTEVLEPISAGCTCMCSELKPVPFARRTTICD